MSPLKTPLSRHRIVITRLVRTQNAKGGFDAVPTTVATTHAKIEGLNGRESVIAMGLEGISVYRLTIRWRAGILQSDQIMLPGGKLLNISSVSDPDGLRKWLVIVASDESVEKTP